MARYPILLFLGLTLLQSSMAQTLTLNEFTRDKTLFDSGAHLGQNQSAVQVSGSADASEGTGVEMRIVNADSGMECYPWIQIATVKDQRWAGEYAGVQRSSDWMVVEVRIKGGTTAKMKARFGVGVVWAIYEQSNWGRIFSSRFSKTPADKVINPEAVQVFQVNRKSGEVTRTLISDATPVSAAVVAMANAIQAERPGEKWAIVAHVQSGTSPVDMIDAPGGKKNQRKWEDEKKLHAAVTADGSRVGIVTDNGWIAFSGGTPTNDDTMVPIVTQKLVDGTLVNLGDDLSKKGGPDFILSHSLSEFYDWSYSRFTMVGPHGRANTSTGGYQDKDDLAYHKMMDEWHAVLSSPDFPEFVPLGFETHGALRGVPKGGSWTDAAHHSAVSKDGLERLAVLGTLSMLRAMNLVEWPRPVFNRKALAPDGSCIDFWMQGFHISTERKNRNLPPIPDTFPHRSEVMGFSIGGEPAQRAVLISNAGGSKFTGVRVYPIQDKFDSESDVQYGLSKQPGFIQFPEDYQDGYYLNLPVVDVGQKALPALPLGTRSTQGL